MLINMQNFFAIFYFMRFFLFKHLLVAHDDIAQENYISLPQPQELAAPPPPGFDCVVEDHRLVTITRPAHHGKPEKPEHLVRQDIVACPFACSVVALWLASYFYCLIIFILCH